MKRFFSILVLIFAVSVLYSGDVIIKKPRELTYTSMERMEPFLEKMREIKERIKPYQNPWQALERLKRRGVTASLHSTRQETLIIRILAIRVDFVREDPDDPLTTGDGGFILHDNGQDSIIQEGNCTSYNPFYDPPHDKKYFERLMEALSNYYRIATYGKVKIEWVVKPDGDTSAYHLPHPMSYYGNMDEWPEGFLSLMRDAIILADRDTTIKLNDLDNNGIIDRFEGVFDRYIIFHAGSAWQTDIMFDTPNDIPAATVLGYPVPVENGTDTIWDATILPETMSQDGVEAKLQGTLFHENGHNLFFFPDLYDVYMNGAGIGAWGIMGNSYYLGIPDVIPEGLLTPLPNVWERTWIDYILHYLWGEGFLNDSVFVTIDPSGEPTLYTILPNSILTDSLLNFLESPYRGPRYFKIPINSHEYYLLEYALDNIESNDTIECPPDTTFIFGKWKDGVVVHFYGENNFLLPGRGLLIWHIDENIFWENYSWNEVNGHRPMAIDLEEADHVQDLEKWTDFSPYPYAWFGCPYDPFFEGNNNRFADETNPSTRTNSGGQTKLAIYDISAPDSVMTFKVVEEWWEEGFPVRVGYGERSFGSMVITDNPVDGYIACDSLYIFTLQTVREDTIVYETYEVDTLGTGYIVMVHVIDSHGNIVDGDTLNQAGVLCGGLALFSRADTVFLTFGTGNGNVYLYRFVNSQLTAVPGFPVRYASSILSTPAIFDIDQDNVPEIFVGTGDNTLLSIGFNGDLKFSVDVGAPGYNTPSFGEEGELIYLSSDGRVLIINNSGEVVDSFLTPYTLPTHSSPIYLEGGRIFVMGASGEAHLLDLSNGELIWTKNLGAPVQGAPAVAFLDEDSTPEFLFVAGGKLYGLNYTGSLLSGFPVSDSFPPGVSPIILKISGQNLILVPLSRGGIAAYTPAGERLDSFFPYIDGRVYLSPTAFDIDGDSTLELAYIDSTGTVYLMNVHNSSSLWPTYGGNERRTFTLTSSFPLYPDTTAALKLLRAYLYPNPTYTGLTTLRFRVNRPGRLRVRVFTFRGEELLTFDFEYSGIDYEERVLNLEELPSGVYYIHLDFGEDVTKILKLAIVR